MPGQPFLSDLCRRCVTYKFMSKKIRTEPGSLIESLSLKKNPDAGVGDEYHGVSAVNFGNRTFGGLLIAQCVCAAGQSVPEGRHIRSLHAAFLQEGRSGLPLRYKVAHLRDGKSFAARSVSVLQGADTVLTCQALFQDDEPGFSHQAPMPDVPPPEALPTFDEMRARMSAHRPERLARAERAQGFFDIRCVEYAHYIERTPLPPRQNVWLRLNGTLAPTRLFASALLAFMSDFALLEASLFCHGASIFDPDMQIASLDHAIWFHRFALLDDWILYSQDSPSAGGARGFARGMLFARSGLLLASTAQEGLIRRHMNVTGQGAAPAAGAP